MERDTDILKFCSNLIYFPKILYCPEQKAIKKSATNPKKNHESAFNMAYRRINTSKEVTEAVNK